MMQGLFVAASIRNLLDRAAGSIVDRPWCTAALSNNIIKSVSKIPL
jgi:hypothetical protein